MSTNNLDIWYARKDHIPVLGHRGIAARFPENTLPSFQAAIDLGVDLIEFDVNRTGDNQLVVIHDCTIDRTSNQTGKTRDYTLAELKSFDFGGWFGPKWEGVRIPTLPEVLSLVALSAKNILLNVEIKDISHETVDDTIHMLARYKLLDRSVVACFDAEIIRYVKQVCPEMRVQGFPGRLMSNFTPETYDIMFGMGIPIKNDPQGKRLREEVAMAKEKGILAWLYTADTKEDVIRCVEAGADNITGNDPEVALEVLREMHLHG